MNKYTQCAENLITLFWNDTNSTQGMHRLRDAIARELERTAREAAAPAQGEQALAESLRNRIGNWFAAHAYSKINSLIWDDLAFSLAEWDAQAATRPEAK